ncbi:MAG: nucleotide exchange factor GrpE [Betaproteobacteria bacterium]|nr:nucleotide exchange factor GrpE [Betaproteobacteria bacterium]
MSDTTQSQATPAAPTGSDPHPPMATTGGEASADHSAADLTDQLQSALAESSQIKDALLRALADSENMRKHAQADVASAHKYAIEGFANNLLPVKDTLEMALADQASSIEQIKLGVELTLKNLAAAFDKAKIVEINPLNQKFDPNRHQAVTQLESELPANTVVQVFQKGYLLQDRVLRPAMVAVAKSRDTAARQGERPVESKGQ